MKDQGSSDAPEQAMQDDAGKRETLAKEIRFRVAVLAIRRTLAGAQTKAFLGTSPGQR